MLALNGHHWIQKCLLSRHAGALATTMSKMKPERPDGDQNTSLRRPCPSPSLGVTKFHTCVCQGGDLLKKMFTNKRWGTNWCTWQTWTSSKQHCWPQCLLLTGRKSGMKLLRYVTDPSPGICLLMTNEFYCRDLLQCVFSVYTHRSDWIHETCQEKKHGGQFTSANPEHCPL